MRAFGLLLATLIGAPLTASGQSITIDGSTVTSVTSNPGGSLSITIAPPDARGVSQNGFSRFDVPTAGASFGNAGVGASAIVAEVSGSSRSQISGSLSVTGDRADVVLVNPNGITINGGRFENMRGLALIAGRRAAGSGTALQYDLSGADIAVGDLGLTANIRRLDLVAQTLSVTGSITDEEALPFVSLGLHAGPGGVTIDPSAFAVDDPEYLTLRNRGAVQGGVSLTLSSGAILSGGTVTMTADGRGAGVQMAGRGLAAAGAFRLSADGAVVLEGAQIEAQGAATLAAGTLTARSGHIRSAAAGVNLTAGAGGAGLDQTDLTALQDIEIQSDHTLTFATLTAQSDAGVTLTSAGALHLDAAQITGKGAVVATAASASFISSPNRRAILVSLTADVSPRIAGAFSVSGALVQGASVTGSAGGLTLQTLSTTQIASIIATTGALGFDVSGTVTNQSGRILSSGTLALTAGGDIRNGVAKSGQTGISENGSRGVLGGKTTTTYGSGNYLAFGEIGQIGATGAATLTAGGRLENRGGEISGSSLHLSADYILNQIEQFGQVDVQRRCVLFFCRSTLSGEYTFDGGRIETSGALSIAAASGFDMIGGTLRGDGGIALAGPAFRFKPQFYTTGYQRPGGIAGLFRGSQVRLYESYEPGSVSSADGGMTFEAGAAISVDGVPLFLLTDVDRGRLSFYSDEPAGLGDRNRNPVGLFAPILD